ncbi:MAG: transporter [Acidobacteriota bacterium]|nr:transporter [Acidobacteriota bacterium]
MPKPQHKPFTRMQSVGLVFLCTIFGAAAQILMKNGVNHMSHFSPIQAITNIPLMAGYCLYGINTLLLMLALRDGELSMLYPIIALTYIWVTMLSTYFFGELITLPKIAGIMVIVGGVTVLGRATGGKAAGKR